MSPNADASSSKSMVERFPELKGLMEGNKRWASKTCEDMPDLLPKLATGQVGRVSEEADTERQVGTDLMRRLPRSSGSVVSTLESRKRSSPPVDREISLSTYVPLSALRPGTWKLNWAQRNIANQVRLGTRPGLHINYNS